jgi:hypothetical protein
VRQLQPHHGCQRLQQPPRVSTHACGCVGINAQLPARHWGRGVASPVYLLLLQLAIQSFTRCSQVVPCAPVKRLQSGCWHPACCAVLNTSAPDSPESCALAACVVHITAADLCVPQPVPCCLLLVRSHTCSVDL